jgi:hypothetical protein
MGAPRRLGIVCTRAPRLLDEAAQLRRRAELRVAQLHREPDRQRRRSAQVRVEDLSPVGSEGPADLVPEPGHLGAIEARRARLAEERDHDLVEARLRQGHDEIAAQTFLGDLGDPSRAGPRGRSSGPRSPCRRSTWASIGAPKTSRPTAPARSNPSPSSRNRSPRCGRRGIRAGRGEPGIVRLRHRAVDRPACRGC